MKYQFSGRKQERNVNTVCTALCQFSIAEYILAQSKLATYNQQRQLIEIDYQFGNGSTTQMLDLWQQGESLEAGVMKIENQKKEITRKIQQLTAQSPPNLGETRGQ